MLLVESTLLKGPIEENELLLLCGLEPTYDNEAPLPPPVFRVAIERGMEVEGNIGERTGGLP